MTKQTEAMRLALEALGQLWLFSDDAAVIANPAITALREALAEQPVQKRPQNCGTGYCSCVECVMEPAQQEQAPAGSVYRYGKDCPEVVQTRAAIAKASGSATQTGETE